MFRVAIVGRPNVGKSTLFNQLSRTRKALVGEEPGITRDRLFQVVTWEGKQFELIDTGGIVPDETETIPEKVFQQAEIAIEEADLVLLVVDVRAQLIPLDEELAALLKERGKPFLLVVNKVDVVALEADAYQFFRLGVDSLHPVSAEHRLGMGELIDAIAALIPESVRTLEEDEIRVAIVGRPNVGKSSLLNRILGTERVIVTDIPGTTRDAVDTPFRFEGQPYRLIDTAGIRRKGRPDLKAEQLSVAAAQRNIEQADVVVLIIEASEGATKLDATIGGYANDAGKSVILAVNKWDLVEKDTHTAHLVEREYRKRMRFLSYAPMLFISAKEGVRVFNVLRVAQEAYKASLGRVSTGELNRFLRHQLTPAIAARQRDRKRRLKYCCQVGVSPPTFVLFTRGSKRLHFSTVRFISNRLREAYGFFATPIRILERPARSEDAKKHRVIP
jgi:GTP-binding protein